MNETWLRQLVQALLQWLIVFCTSMAVYKGLSEITKIGWGDALYQPIIQATLAALGIKAATYIPVGKKKENGNATP